MALISALIALIFLIHALFFAWLIYRWGQIPCYTAQLDNADKEWPYISLLVPARNESAHIGLLINDLSALEYPRHRWEVIVCDDHSDDNTAEIVQAMIADFPVPLRIYRHPGTGKKQALEFMASVALGDYLLCTDADCRCGPGRLMSFASALRRADFKYLYGPVHVVDVQSWWQGIESYETSVLSLTGAATLHAGLPTMSNGANMLFHKQTFLDEGAYADTRHIASGDDEFLLHRMARRHLTGFVKDADAAVSTKASSHINELINRRIRWASKWKHYRNPFIRLLAVWVFGVNLCVWPTLLLLPFHPPGLYWLVLGLMLKTAGEAGAAWVYRNYYKLPIRLTDLLLMSATYPLLGVVVALRALRGKYEWKGRPYAS